MDAFRTNPRHPTRRFLGNPSIHEADAAGRAAASAFGSTYACFFSRDMDALTAATDPLQEKLESISLKPTKANITVTLVALVWTPHWRSAAGAMTPAWE